MYFVYVNNGGGKNRHIVLKQPSVGPLTPDTQGLPLQQSNQTKQSPKWILSSSNSYNWVMDFQN